MKPLVRRPPRYSFVTVVEVVDLHSETSLQGKTTDLSMFGCFVETWDPLPPETKVRVKITSRGAQFVALGRVARVRPSAGMGITFTDIAPNDQQTLEEWISQLRTS